MNIYLGVAFAENGTALCGVGETREAARVCVESIIKTSVRFSLPSQWGTPDVHTLEDFDGDLVGAVRVFELDTAAERMLARLLDPEDMGMAVSEDIRNHARRALGLSIVEIRRPVSSDQEPPVLSMSQAWNAYQQEARNNRIKEHGFDPLEGNRT